MSATHHKIDACRSGTFNGMDYDEEYVITFGYRSGRREVRYLRNGDPGYPADPPEVEFISISPGPGDNAAFPDLAQKWLEEWANDWLDEHEDDAIEQAESDLLKVEENDQ
jgi:hypothetical protein